MVPQRAVYRRTLVRPPRKSAVCAGRASSPSPWLIGNILFDPRDAEELDTAVFTLDPRRVTYGRDGRMLIAFANETDMVLFKLGPFENEDITLNKTDLIARVGAMADPMPIWDWLEEMLPNSAVAAIAAIELDGDKTLTALRQALGARAALFHQEPDVHVRPVTAPHGLTDASVAAHLPSG